jgi:CheY-like chemotaxis protein
MQKAGRANWNMTVSGIGSLLTFDDTCNNPATRMLPDTDMEVAGECADGRAAVAAIEQIEPDLLLLDIQMPHLDGFEMLSAIGPERMPHVIFVTAYDQFALRAFEVHALDYLLKPFSDRRFFDAATGSFVCRIAVKQEGRVVLVILNDGTRGDVVPSAKRGIGVPLGTVLVTRA